MENAQEGEEIILYFMVILRHLPAFIRLLRDIAKGGDSFRPFFGRWWRSTKILWRIPLFCDNI